MPERSASLLRRGASAAADTDAIATPKIRRVITLRFLMPRHIRQLRYRHIIEMFDIAIDTLYAYLLAAALFRYYAAAARCCHIFTLIRQLMPIRR